MKMREQRHPVTHVLVDKLDTLKCTCCVQTRYCLRFDKCKLEYRPRDRRFAVKPHAPRYKKLWCMRIDGEGIDCETLNDAESVSNTQKLQFVCAH